jgi:hypothetical protein
MVHYSLGGLGPTRTKINLNSKLDSRHSMFSPGGESDLLETYTQKTIKYKDHWRTFHADRWC